MQNIIKNNEKVVLHYVQFYSFNSKPTDGFVTQIIRASAVMVLKSLMI